MTILVFLLVLAAFLFALFAVFNVFIRVNAIAASLACYFLSILLPMLRTILTLCVVVTMALSFSGCANTDSTAKWQARLAPDSLAGQTVTAVAQHYGGNKSAELASAGLYATADVLQGYVDKKPPIDVITASPGVEGVGHIVLDYLKNKGVVTQATVDALHKAAAFAARLTYTAPTSGK